MKGGYLQIDEAPFLGSELINYIFEHVRLRLGHFEVNYGDSHFRRTDNGNGIWNPFVGNYLEDPFTTEIGGEVYVYKGPLFIMGAVTGGEIKGDIPKPKERSQSLYGKVGYDSQISSDLRLRLTGSIYHNGNAASNTLFSGDRAGSRYYLVLEPTGATTNGNARNGLMVPGFSEKVTAMQINPFVKSRALELFGVLDIANGRTATETEDRNCKLYSVEALYRFVNREQVYVGGRYQLSKGEMPGTRDEVEMERIQIGAGWYATKNILLKAEYVTQTYDGFPVTNILNGGKFNGFVIEGVVAF